LENKGCFFCKNIKKVVAKRVSAGGVTDFACESCFEDNDPFKERD
jgi:hypothetical protein